MTVAVAANSEAHLTVTDGVIRRSATYEVHLNGADLVALAAIKHPDGVPGALWDAIREYISGSICRRPGDCLTDHQLFILEENGCVP